jgi:hypothetical protein
MFLMLFLSNITNASITNLSCQYQYNRVVFNYSGVYNHGWVYVNGNQVGDFLKVSSGTGDYVTTLKKGDNVLILWYNTVEGYGQSNSATC